MSIFIFTACSSESAKDRFHLYRKAWEDKDYQEMYSFLSQESKDYIKEEEFLERYENIYSGIAAEDIKINIDEEEKDKETIAFNLEMTTLAGKIDLDGYRLKMVKEKQGDENSWFVEWDESLIFPQMSKEDKVGVRTIAGKRGEIYDRDGNPLAVNGQRYSVGIHPANYDKASNSELAEVLDIDQAIIEEKLDKNTNPEHFVPLVKISVEEFDMLGKLVNIQGIKLEDVEARVYPGGEAFGSLIGYIKPITAEELEEDKEGAYTSTSLIGKAGLESVYEETLRSKDAREVYISKIEDGEVLENIVLVKSEGKDGEDLKISVDSSLQKKIYEEMDGEIGTANAIDPKTGEVLAMVSSPSFDSNIYTTYISDSQRKEWDQSEVNVFENRFNNLYSPASTFKVITGAIGLEKGLIDPDEKISIEGKSWQKDPSWGGYKINRVSQKLSSVNLRDAYIYSDNIYFARAALEIGAEDFIEEAKKFGFGEELAINYPFPQSQITNSGELKNEILLADTGYGQGEILMSPLHVSLVYSMLVNDGNIMEPKLKKDEEEFKVWKEDLISKANREIILNSLVEVIENKDGSGHEARIENIRLAGKTGTAELKLSQEDKGQENGWFVAMNLDDPKIVISMMIEGVEDRGGSGYVVPKVRNVLEGYLN